MVGGGTFSDGRRLRDGGRLDRHRLRDQRGRRWRAGDRPDARSRTLLGGLGRRPEAPPASGARGSRPARLRREDQRRRLRGRRQLDHRGRPGIRRSPRRTMADRDRHRPSHDDRRPAETRAIPVARGAQRRRQRLREPGRHRHDHRRVRRTRSGARRRPPRRRRREPFGPLPVLLPQRHRDRRLHGLESNTIDALDPLVGPPQFTGPGDYHLPIGSPAIDTGIR